LPIHGFQQQNKHRRYAWVTRQSKQISCHRARLDTRTNDGRANLPVCPNLTASKRSKAGGTVDMRTRTSLRSF